MADDTPKETLCGQPHTGKTWTAKELAGYFGVRRGIPTIVHDHRAQYPERNVYAAAGVDFPRGKLVGWKPAELLTVCRRQSVEEVCAAAVAYCNRYSTPVLVVIDELWHGSEGARWKALTLQEIVFEGRHMGNGAGCGLIGCTLRPQGIHPSFTACAERVYVFCMTGKNEGEYVQRWMGEAAWERVKALAPRPHPTRGAEFLFWSPAGEPLPGCLARAA